MPLTGKRVLVVEDVGVVMVDLADILSGAGAEVFPTVRLDQAMEAVDGASFSAAIVDIRLGTEDSTPLCQRLTARGIPFLLYSGYTEGLDGWTHVPFLRKPAQAEHIVKAVARLCSPSAGSE